MIHHWFNIFVWCWSVGIFLLAGQTHLDADAAAELARSLRFFVEVCD